MTEHSDGGEAVTASSSIRLGSSIDVVASVPYLLGFAPADSLVLVFFARQSNRLVVTGRVDYPRVVADQGTVFAQCRCVFASAVKAGATGVHVIAYPPVGAEAVATDERDSARALCLRLVAMAKAADLTVLGSGFVTANHWFDSSLPDTGGVMFDPAATAVAAGFVSKGVSYLPDREALRARVVGPPTDLARDVKH
ncbi:MAG: DUF4192 family protein, partial [Actinomycetes bacterium]